MNKRRIELTGLQEKRNLIILTQLRDSYARTAVLGLSKTKATLLYWLSKYILEVNNSNIIKVTSNTFLISELKSSKYQLLYTTRLL